MAETRTETKINVYAGVPFNTKYQNVLFVDKQTRDLFLQQYEVGTQITAGRFEIVNDTQAIIDISNEYGTMSVNYVKVHRTLIPETSIHTFEYDQFYFVDHTLQIGTNAVRLFLDLDIFQTYFVKYNYQTQSYEIPEIKNSRCEISTDFDGETQQNTLLDPSQYYTTTYWKLFDFLDEEKGARCYVVITFTDQFGQHVAISKNSYYCLSKTSQNETASDITFFTILLAIYGSFQMYEKMFDGTFTQRNITVQSIHLIPREMLIDNMTEIQNLDECYFDVSSVLTPPTTAHAEFYMTNGYTSTSLPLATVSISDTITNEYDGMSIGTFSKRIEIPRVKTGIYFEIKMTFAQTFKIILMCNNQTIDLTDDFEYTLLESTYATYMQQHQNGIAIKSIASILNLGSGIASMASGNVAGIIQTGKGLSGIASEIASFVDLQSQPMKVNATPSVQNNIALLNGIGVFIADPTNRDEIEKTEKYYGYKMNYLTSKSFSFMSVESNKNFDYYKFSNVEFIGSLPESFKSRFEEMFLNGIRIWYSTTNFLNTIENTETQNQ